MSFFCLNIVPLIGSDCPSQSRDAIPVAIETSSASAERCADNVAATFLRGCHSNNAMNMTRGSLLKIRGDCRGPGSDLIECLFLFVVFLSFFIKLVLSKVVKGKLYRCFGMFLFDA